MWQQVYDPFGNSLMSTIAAAVPVVTLLVLIATGAVKTHLAALIALLLAIVIAVLLFTMPAGLAIRASILGAVIGFFPIGWIVLNVIFMYRLTVATGAFGTLQQAIGGVTPDRRLQVLLISFAFGAFFEGASGFGTPVAVTAAILIGLGFSPLAASGLSLIANTAPVAYGALGTPIVGLASVTGLDPYLLGAMVGRQLPFFSLIVPAWVICAFTGWRGMVQIWPAIVVCGVSFATPQYLISNFINPWIVDIGASLICMACLIGFFRIWQPAELWTSPALRSRDDSAATMPPPPPPGPEPTTEQVWQSLVPWIIVCAVLLIWGTGWFKTLVNPIFTWNYAVEGLHNVIQKVPPVVAKPSSEGAIFAFTYLSFTGTGMLIAAIISGLVMRIFSGSDGKSVWRNDTHPTLFADHDFGDARHWDPDAVLGHRRDARTCFRRRRRAVPLLRDFAWMVRCRADRLGYRLERALRGTAEDHCRAARPVPNFNGRGQLLRRRDGQNDRRAIDRRGFDCDQLVRARRLDPPLCVFSFDRARQPGRTAGHVPGLCIPRHDRALSAGNLSSTLSRGFAASLRNARGIRGSCGGDVTVERRRRDAEAVRDWHSSI